MCLAVVALDAHPAFALVIAANRDEFHARAAAPAAWGDAPPFARILAGRDLEAGGTWLGVRRDGRWALVTNVREGGRHDPAARSRGELVPDVLNAPGRTADALHACAAAGARYNGFNLLAGDATRAHWISNRGGGPARLAARPARPVERAARHAVAETRAHDGADARVARAARIPTPARCSRRSRTARRRRTTRSPRPASRATGSGCCRRRSSSAKATARAARRS